MKKGADARMHMAAGRLLKEAGIQVSAYLILGLGGQDRTDSSARESARVINDMAPDFLRLRTLVPKVRTPLLDDVRSGRFQLLGPHGVLRETLVLLENLTVPTTVVSDHYTNYLDVNGRLPEDREAMLAAIRGALTRDESTFRPFFVGTE